jgi:hypothetical protein
VELEQAKQILKLMVEDPKMIEQSLKNPDHVSILKNLNLYDAIEAHEAPELATLINTVDEELNKTRQDLIEMAYKNGCLCHGNYFM